MYSGWCLGDVGWVDVYAVVVVLTLLVLVPRFVTIATWVGLVGGAFPVVVGVDVDAQNGWGSSKRH